MPSQLPHSIDGPAWWASVALVLALALAAGFAGSGSSLPLDSHEVFVARTGEEMLARRQYVVPYINDQPRLKKPPMNYWLAILAAKTFGDGEHVSEFQSRLPSILAGVGVAILTVLMGAMLFDRPTGLLAGLLVVSCSGYLGYSHSARPEMLYAFFCTLGLFGWMKSERRRLHGGSEASVAKARWFAWMGWLAMGLAMLTKGPQLPAILLLGFVVYLAWTGRRGRVGAILRPWSGLLIFLAVSMWWYVLVFTSVTDSLAIWKEEAAHRARGNWWTLLDPYYLYRTPGLLLPWVVGYVLALLSPWGERLRASRAVKLCWSLLVAAMLALSLATGRRWYYMLPVLAPMGVLMAAAALDAAGWLVRRRGGRGLLMGVLLGHAVVFPLLALWALMKAPSPIAPSLHGVIVIMTGYFVLVGTLAGWQRRSRAVSPLWPIGMTVVVVSCSMMILSLHDSLGSNTRIPRRGFALEVARLVPGNESLVGYTDAWQVETYYTRRAIHAYSNAQELGQFIQQAGLACVLTPDQPGRRLTLDESRFHVEPLLAFDCPVFTGPPERLALWRVTLVR